MSHARLAEIRIARQQVALAPGGAHVPRVRSPWHIKSLTNKALHVLHIRRKSAPPAVQTWQVEMLEGALKHDDWPRVMRLVDNSTALVNRQDETGRTPVHLALDAGRLDVARYLANHKATEDVVDHEGRSAIAYIAALDRNEPVDWIPLAFTSLMKCLVRGDEWQFATLLARPDHAEIVNYRDPQGKTLLRHAIEQKKTGISYQLAQHAGTRDMPDTEGRFATEVALDAKRSGGTHDDFASYAHALAVGMRWHHDQTSDTALDFVQRPAAELPATHQALNLEFQALCATRGLPPDSEFSSRFRLERMSGSSEAEVEIARQILRQLPPGIPLDSQTLSAALKVALLHHCHDHDAFSVENSVDVQRMRQMRVPSRELQLLEAMHFTSPMVEPVPPTQKLRAKVDRPTLNAAPEAVHQQAREAVYAGTPAEIVAMRLSQDMHVATAKAQQVRPVRVTLIRPTKT